MEDFFKNDEFAQFILTEYLSHTDMTDMQKFEKVGSSVEDFIAAVDCFKLSRNAVSLQ